MHDYLNENNQLKYWVGEKFYSVSEFEDLGKSEEKMKDFYARFEQEAENIGNNIYIIKLKNPNFGLHKIFVSAVDNGGRTNGNQVKFTVKGNSKIEIVQPKAKQIFSPNSDITVETLTTVNDSRVKRVYLQKINRIMDNNYSDPIAALISNEGNVYKHKYIWKNFQLLNTVYQTIQAVLIEDSGAVTESEPINFIVRELPKIKITSLENGQEVDGNEDIKILFEKENEISADDFGVYIDEIYKGNVSSGYIWRDGEKGIHTIQIIAKFDGIELSKSEKITIKVK